MPGARTRLVVLGGSGLVGSRFLELSADQFELIAPSHAALDVLDTPALADLLRQSAAPLVLNLAAWADVDGAEAERSNTSGRVYQLNSVYPGRLAELCGESGIHLVHVSTDYVFDGTSATRAYRESDAPGPLSWYAQTKAAGEQRVLDSGASAAVARIEMPFTPRPHRKTDFSRLCLNAFQSGREVVGVVDQHITPVFLDDAVRALALLLQHRTPGIMHVAAAEATTPFDFAQAIARRLNAPLELVRPERFERFVTQRPARRPQHSWLDVTRFQTEVSPGVLRGMQTQLRAWTEQLAALPGLAERPGMVA